MGNLHDFTLVALAQRPWAGQRMLPQQIVSRLAPQFRHTVYSVGPMSVWDIRSGASRSTPFRGKSTRVEGIDVLTPGWFLPRWPTVPLWDQAALGLFARRLRTYRREASGLLCYAMHPSYLPLVEALRPDVTVYHQRDAWTLNPSSTAKTRLEEERLLDRSQLVVSASAEMAKLLPGDGPQRARVLLNGADVAAFEEGPRLPEPEDLCDVPRPRIGYAGSINRKVDLTLVAEVAARRPDWHWVFIGRTMENEWSSLADDDPMRAAWHTCKALANVHFLGEKPFHAVPGYAGHMDVNVMCYRTQGGWWEAGYPLKLHEYLAVGKPVIGSDISSLRPYAEVVAIPESPAEWIQAIEDALGGRGKGSPDARKSVARENSWDRRVEILTGWIAGLLGDADNTRDDASV